MIVEKYFTEILKSIVSMTFTGSIVAISLFVIKPFIKNKLSKSFQYYMWLSVIIVLILPLSKIIVIPMPSTLETSMSDNVQRIADNVLENPINFVLRAQIEYRQMIYIPHLMMVLFFIWLSVSQCDTIEGQEGMETVEKQLPE